MLTQQVPVRIRFLIVLNSIVLDYSYGLLLYGVGVMYALNLHLTAVSSTHHIARSPNLVFPIVVAITE
jgi:hypothetical protein